MQTHYLTFVQLVNPPKAPQTPGTPCELGHLPVNIACKQCKQLDDIDPVEVMDKAGEFATPN
jgi:hypothetical protein